MEEITDCFVGKMRRGGFSCAQSRTWIKSTSGSIFQKDRVDKRMGYSGGEAPGFRD